ncbi:uncharacterized protein LOC129981601 [Argiope bruennichi]|uniref:uncharacterized protein LOC129981601 n=1 Tax=Argiope bruennichi TaxID=94029 RepID=UPI0024959074|nr:uncharacterized protein LOC129981601 [Argiope bruennichi]
MMIDWLLIGYGVLGGIAAIILPKCILCCIGFTCCGVRKHSAASFSHSSIGDVERGSCFAMCQSVGASGFPCCINFMLFVLGFTTTVFLIYMESSGGFSPDSGNFTTDGNVTMMYSTHLLQTTPLA